MRPGFVIGEHVPFCIAARDVNVGQVGDHLERCHGLWSDRDEIAEHPPLVHVLFSTVCDDRLERMAIAMNVRKEPELHPKIFADGLSTATGSRRMCS